MHFQHGNKEQGRLTFSRWKDRFTLFLQRHTPHEAKRFTQIMSHQVRIVRKGEHPYNEFMREDGKTCLAFIDTLAAEGRKGRIIDFQENPLPEKELAEPAKSGDPYVHPTRLVELRAIPSSQFDLSRLIRLCEELNVCYANECFMAVTMLVRTILDHVPPIFQFHTFDEVVNNYGGGGKSFKETMQRLDGFARPIASGQLHQRIRGQEALPNRIQVAFSAPLDLLLGEIVRILKSQPAVPGTGKAQ